MLKPLLIPLIVFFFLPGFARAADAPPNILILLADDMGFSDAGCYGGEISTPNLDRLAAGGLRFTQFYNTARCWPTRSCLITGYYAQQIRADPPKGLLPKWAKPLPFELKPLGYRAYHSGKWHVPGAPKTLADGGFDRSYRIEDHDRAFNPNSHLEDDKPLPPIPPGSEFYITTHIADHAIQCLKDHAANHAGKPFFSYVAFTSPHFPLRAPQADIEKYRDKYLQGWEAVRNRRHERVKELGIVEGELRPAYATPANPQAKPQLQEKLGPGEVYDAPPWASLTGEQKKFQATKMAIHAAMVDRMDREIGRILDQLRAMDALDNTVVLFLSDNGASAEQLIRGDGHDPAAAPGSAASYLCLGPGWATASNAPLRNHKMSNHEGGTSTPLIVHWPKGIAARGEFRRTPGHVIDFYPTILELAGSSVLPLPLGESSKGTLTRLGESPSAAKGAGGGAGSRNASPPHPGKSLLPAFASDTAIERDHLFFNHEGNRALRVGDWKLVSAKSSGNVWELYNLAADRSETHDLAAKHPQRVKEMEEKWNDLETLYRSQPGEP